MARRYVRDKIGRFAAKGGGGKRAGKLSKSTAGRSAKAKYKSATSKLRGAERSFKSASRSSAIMSKKASRAGYKGKTADKALSATIRRNYAAKDVSAAKGRVTRVTNKMTKKGVAKAKISEKKQRAQDKAAALGRARPRVRKLAAGRKKAAATRAKTAEKKAAVKAKKVEAKKNTAAKKKALAKSKSYSGLTPKQQYKAARSRVRAEKSGYMQDRGEGYNRAGKVSGKGRVKRSMKYSDYGVKYTNQGSFVGAARAQRTRVKNKLTKGSTQGKGYGLSKKGKAAKAKFRELKRQRGGATKGRGTIAQRKASLNYRTTNQAFGAKNKRPVSKAARDYIGKSNIKEMEAKASRGKGSKAERRMKNLKGRKG